MTVSTVKVTLNGTTYSLTAGDNNTWSTSITAPTLSSGSNNSGSGVSIGSAASGKGYYPVTVTATDTAGNSTTKGADDATLGSSLQLKVLETTAPVAAITFPTSGAYVTNGKPTFQYTAYDAGSGVKATYYQLDDGTATAVASASGSGTSSSPYAYSYTPSTALSEGSHTFKVYSVDYDGNTSSTVTSTFTVDTVPPTLSVTNPSEGLWTNTKSYTVTGTCGDSTSGISSITVKVGSGTAKAATISGSSWSCAVTLAEGANTLTVVATDKAGKTTTVTRTINIDTAAPVITAVTLTPNPVDGGKTVTISVTVTDS